MYKCEKCNRPMDGGPHKFVIEKRKKDYIPAHPLKGKGWEIAKEINVCPLCYRELDKAAKGDIKR